MMKVDELGAFSQHVAFISYRSRLSTSTADESSSYIHFHCDLSAPAMSTDLSQVDIALFPYF